MYTPSNGNELCSGAYFIPLCFFIYKIDRTHFSMYIHVSCVHVTFVEDAAESGEDRAGAARANRLAAWGTGHIEHMIATSIEVTEDFFVLAKEKVATAQCWIKA